ncbi:MAG: hypothetical protein HY692_08495, partial [Cyanobacteria bacterium NC_groundwater_1444_Ag_S-0.65um_54_12]|nr:hypothetical protein [Cyanobacteria bacterium NC_groundwater_1444_Ag_S-0.65um_54_12]
ALVSSFGLGAVIDWQQISGAPVKQSELANRTFLGIGPATRVRWDLSPLSLDWGMQLQVGALIGSPTGAGFGIAYQAEGRYPLLPDGILDALAGLRGQLVLPAAGGFDFHNGLLVGTGGKF